MSPLERKLSQNTGGHLAAPLPSCAPWAKLLRFPEPQFSYLKNDNNDDNGGNSQ